MTLLDDGGKKQLCDRIAILLCKRLRVNAISPTVLDQTWGQAFEIAAIREAWVYRDWQGAIGDLMIRDVEHGERRFDVIGFSEFESICMNGTDDQKKWIARLSAIFDEIDIAVHDRFDHRPKQLRGVLRATAILIQALSGSSGPTQQISDDAHAVAKSLTGA